MSEPSGIPEVRELLGERYRLVYSVKQIPSLVRSDFASAYGEALDMVDAAQVMTSCPALAADSGEALCAS